LQSVNKHSLAAELTVQPDVKVTHDITVARGKYTKLNQHRYKNE